MKDRIKKIIESQHMTQQEFAETIKVAPATLSSIFTGRTAPSLKIVDAIKTRFPDISTDWLLFGHGAMTDYKVSEAGSTFDHSSSTDDGKVLDFGASPLVGADTDGTNAQATIIDAGTTASGRKTTATSFVSAQPEKYGVSTCAGIDGVHMVKDFNTKERRIVEIRIFYDDQTWETFVPKK